MTLRNLTSAIAVAALMSAAATANAATICYDGPNSFTVTNPIYVAGSTALAPTLQALAPAAAMLGYTIVHYDNGSCGAIANITSGSNQIPANTGAKPPTYFPADGSAKKACLPMDMAGGTQITTPIDVVLSDVDARLCPNVSGGLPTGFTDATGPVNAMIFAVPMSSQQNAISAEQAYLVFGQGPTGNVAPWTGDPTTTYHVRGNTSGTRGMINANIGDIDHGGSGSVKGSMKAWFGKDEGGAGAVISKLAADNATTTSANVSIGIIGMNDLLLNAAATMPAPIKALAFRAFGQKLAFWPGSTQNGKDMRNVRDGRYKIWGYVHMITPTGAATAAATAFLGLVNDPAAIAGVVKAGLTPVCAMHVTHDYEGQDQKVFSAAKPCDCFFEKTATGSAPTTCKTCASDGECSGGRCDLHTSGATTVGYCEAK
jgi:ABC-type phosphate transport system substrate-binding protein